MSSVSNPSKTTTKPQSYSNDNFSLPHAFKMTLGSALHPFMITGAVARKYNEEPMAYAEIQIENAEPWEPKKSDRKRKEKLTQPNPKGAGRKSKSPQLKLLEDRLALACYDYSIFRAALIKVHKSKSTRRALNSKYTDLEILSSHKKYFIIPIESVFRIGYKASLVREQNCAPHLKHLLPKNIVSHFIENSDDASLTNHMDFLWEVINLLGLAALTLETVNMGKNEVARLVRKTRRFSDQITGKIPSDEAITKMIFGKSETLFKGGQNTNEIIAVPFHFKYAISLLGQVAGHNIWLDSQEHPRVYNLKLFFDLAVIIGRLSAGEIVTTSREMILYMYDENNTNTSNVHYNEGFKETRACRQYMLKCMSIVMRGNTWSEIAEQMAAKNDEVTITPRVEADCTHPLF
jgi:hypothetical protein